MDILLTAINAKYIHSNLAVYSLKAYANQSENNISIAEYTINQRTDEILMDLYKRKPEVLCFSCYIWNWLYVKELIRDIKKILPQTHIWLGGPEVSYDAADVLVNHPQVELVMKGEGEETFRELAEKMQIGGIADSELDEIKGITFRRSNGTLCENEWRETMDMDLLPFVYQDLKKFENKIIYYETSRGCPFSCSYCLSSIDKKLRFRSVELVKKELQFFLDHKVSQVKFVDRTFNCEHKHAMEIWTYIKEHDNGITNFHFEVAADIFREDEIELLRELRPGLVQLEIGVQSTNEQTIKEIRRVMDFGQVSEVVTEINKGENVHQHLDLIVGLPYENYECFSKSFNQVYALQPEQLQLGFLKVLKGSFMEQKKEEYELVYKGNPPYEVLSTKWVSYEDVSRLKQIEEMVEIYYNSGQFSVTIPFLEKKFESPFRLYEALAIYYEEHQLHTLSHSRVRRYEILLDFAKERDGENTKVYRELLTYDLYLRENLKSRPCFSKEERVDKEFLRAFYENEADNHNYLKGYEEYDKKQMRKMTHIECFHYDLCGEEVREGKLVLFDYKNRNPINGQAAVFHIG
ncbi:B12-binding domain-containing radical SAM protein [Lachnospiraceae bacterium OttesenSCG-928-E19]|nr:B12-binding domain-containing radical SAM protein [Lachnospiraceae bacterium OttesenSCG-928-E19]